MARQVFAVLDEPRFADVFAPGSRPEVPIVGRIARPGGEPVEIAGQVDRLIVTGDAVLIADYKTDRVVPRELDEVDAVCHPARALPRGAGAALSRESGARGADLYQRSSFWSRSRRRLWTQHWMRNFAKSSTKAKF